MFPAYPANRVSGRWKVLGLLLFGLVVLLVTDRLSVATVQEIDADTVVVHSSLLSWPLQVGFWTGSPRPPEEDEVARLQTEVERQRLQMERQGVELAELRERVGAAASPGAASGSANENSPGARVPESLWRQPPSDHKATPLASWSSNTSVDLQKDKTAALATVAPLATTAPAPKGELPLVNLTSPSPSLPASKAEDDAASSVESPFEAEKLQVLGAKPAPSDAPGLPVVPATPTPSIGDDASINISFTTMEPTGAAVKANTTRRKEGDRYENVAMFLR